ncbi:lytic transglycosylase domain-containing protein [Paraburkholderia fungorum]|uniref:lytic transglycosylase domain-containing protein n=1 Tax=Paraburkholderia fungorum TaxID=134537 RepID=UPI0020986213|nr:lytic transglycosylase domain-containing protein [Paraburkholderia fungorum]USX06692.1 lytic transglycosylase domain-containing protein [Paraburkholderia fungorum]
MLDFNSLAQQCAPNVHPMTLQAVVRTESGFNPYAIGVVGGHLVRQPRDRAEAETTAKALSAQGINFSMGLGQVNKANLARYGLTYETAFDPCENLRAGSAILRDCYERATAAMGQGAPALRAAISCYYSGNFTRGESADAGGTSYVQRVVANAQMAAGSSAVVPAIPVVMDSQSGRPAHAAAPDAKTSSARRSGPKQRQDVPHPSWDAFGDSACDDDCN